MRRIGLLLVFGGDRCHVRRRMILDKERFDLTEDAAHLMVEFMQRFVGVASVDFGL
jgi:hypothetical protein